MPAIETARMTQTVSQNLVSGADQVVNFDSLAFDSTGGRMPNLGINYLICSTPGSYLITASMRMNAAPVGSWEWEQGFSFTLSNNNNTEMAWFTAPVTGTYAVSGACWFSGHAGTWVQAITLNVNGIAITGSGTFAGGGLASSASMTRQFTAGDRISFYGYQNSGVSLALSSVGATPLFSVHLVQPTQRYISVWRNGNTNDRLAEANTYTIGDVGSLSLSTLAQLGQGDQVGLFAYQSSGGSLSTGTTFSDNHLAMALLSPS